MMIIQHYLTNILESTRMSLLEFFAHRDVQTQGKENEKGQGRQISDANGEFFLGNCALSIPLFDNDILLDFPVGRKASGHVAASGEENN